MSNVRKVNIDGIWRTILDTQVKIGTSWRPITNISVKIANEWRQSYSIYNNATGGDISYYTSSGKTYKVHTFLSGSTTFTVTNAVAQFEILAVGGGGGAGSTSDAASDLGGGAGGAVIQGAVSLTETSYTVTVGAAGATKSQGGSTSFGSYTAVGGGGANVHNGGSITQPAVSPLTAGYSRSGGGYGGQIGGGGGAGAGGNGATGGDGTGMGAGGSGVSSSIITGSSVTYGVGGNGCWNTGSPGAGAANTGHGGSGLNSVGASGIAAVRYVVADIAPTPNLTYSADGQFTISNYDAAQTYTVSGATRTGAVLTGVSDNATITAKYTSGSTASSARTMRVQAHGRVLDAVQQNFSSAGCGTRSDSCCGSNWIMGTDGHTCGGSPGTQGNWTECGGSCPGNCFGYFNVQCWSWHWTDYSGSGYTQIGNTWGKAV